MEPGTKFSLNVDENCKHAVNPSLQVQHLTLLLHLCMKTGKLLSRANRKSETLNRWKDRSSQLFKNKGI